MNSANELEEASSVLMLAPAVRDTGASAVARLLERGQQFPDRVVAVTITQAADNWIDAWRHHGDTRTKISCIDVDSETRSATTDGGSGRQTTVPVERVAEPSDLETLGRAVSEALERADENGERVSLAVHSVTDLLHHLEEATVFKFVYTLGEVIRRVDGTVYLHLDADAHDAETIETFAAACDAVVELDGSTIVSDGPTW